MKRESSAVWEGGLKDGRGTLTTQSGTLSNTAYNFSGRFESGTGTNPEELIGAAEAGCFTMALASQLEQAGTKAHRIETRATVTLDKVPEGMGITNVHLQVTARVPGVDAASFQKTADTVRATCIISRVLKTEITMEARLEG